MGSVSTNCRVLRQKRPGRLGKCIFFYNVARQALRLDFPEGVDVAAVVPDKNWLRPSDPSPIFPELSISKNPGLFCILQNTTKPNNFK